MKLYKKIITYALLSAGSLGLLGCDDKSGQLEKKVNELQMVEWGLPKDCHAGHACAGEPVNGLVRSQDCHASHFCGSEVYTIRLPKGQTPTEENYKQVIEDKALRIAEHRR